MGLQNYSGLFENMSDFPGLQPSRGQRSGIEPTSKMGKLLNTKRVSLFSLETIWIILASCEVSNLLR